MHIWLLELTIPCTLVSHFTVRKKSLCHRKTAAILLPCSFILACVHQCEHMSWLCLHYCGLDYLGQQSRGQAQRSAVHKEHVSAFKNIYSHVTGHPWKLVVVWLDFSALLDAAL